MGMGWVFLRSWAHLPLPKIHQLGQSQIQFLYFDHLCFENLFCLKKYYINQILHQPNTTSTKYYISQILHQPNTTSTKYYISQILHQPNTTSTKYYINQILHQPNTTSTKYYINQILHQPANLTR